jgi:hypothetical protein
VQDASHPSAPTEEGGSLLEVATKLGRQVRGTWVVGLFPDASEAGGSFRPSLKASKIGLSTPDPARPGEEAARRAGTSIRRYAASNRLNRLGTLTYATGCHDQRQLRADVGDFFRVIREKVGEPFPYLWVPEWHPSGHGLHVHFAVGRYIRQSAIKTAWGRGFVHIKLIGDVPMGQGQLGEARIAARYLAKYVRKGLGDEREKGLHRYECAQGFQPRVERIVAHTAHAAIGEASERMGRWPELIWRSRDADRWFGPPAVWVSWNR